MAIDKLIHEQARLRIMSLLAASDTGAATFNGIREELDMTAGNVSVQLRKLAEAGYVMIEKAFRDNKPLTTVSITPRGTEALQAYVAEMETILRSLK